MQSGAVKGPRRARRGRGAALSDVGKLAWKLPRLPQGQVVDRGPDSPRVRCVAHKTVSSVANTTLKLLGRETSHTRRNLKSNFGRERQRSGLVGRCEIGAWKSRVSVNHPLQRVTLSRVNQPCPRVAYRSPTVYTLICEVWEGF